MGSFVSCRGVGFQGCWWLVVLLGFGLGLGVFWGWGLGLVFLCFWFGWLGGFVGYYTMVCLLVGLWGTGLAFGLVGGLGS